ncbi:unnamed protein product [Periconia digitata]|uniref:Uncharacterized protein n=1 Tax=Periconia digitata TaxID=1303443 RepID=A0A9W4UMG7_9PLEO|nr:unnamed protein product [Periconia digitata]
MLHLASLIGLRSPNPHFGKWFRTASIDDVLNLFTDLVKSGAPDFQASAISESELDYLERLLDSFPALEYGGIDLTAVGSYLIANHPRIQSHVEDVSPTALSLLLGHCNFPFATEVKPSKDALIRSIALLTSSSDYMFSQEADIGSEPAIRARTVTARLEYIFSVLAHPPKGVPTQDDVLDVLCRIPYPFPVSPTFVSRHTITSLQPMAARLLPSSTDLPSRDSLRLSVAVLRPLADLCNIMITDRGAKAESLLEGKDELNELDFVVWAEAVELHGCLNSLFSVFMYSNPDVLKD